MALFDWLGSLFGGASAASDVAAATSGAGSAAAGAGAALTPAGAGMFDGPPVFGTGNQVQGVIGGDLPLASQPGTWDQIAGGAGKLSDALKKLGGDAKTGQGQQPNFLAAGSPQQGRGNPQALAPLVNMLQQRQAALLEAQQAGKPLGQIRTIGLLGF